MTKSQNLYLNLSIFSKPNRRKQENFRILNGVIQAKIQRNRRRCSIRSELNDKRISKSDAKKGVFFPPREKAKIQRARFIPKNHTNR